MTWTPQWSWFQGRMCPCRTTTAWSSPRSLRLKRSWTQSKGFSMPEKILMMALSPTMETGTLVRWRKKEGEAVASGDVLCEVETDKATMDYESTSDGTLLKIVVPAGGQAKVGDTIAIMGKPGEDFSALLAEAKPAAVKPAPAAGSSAATVAAGAVATRTAPAALAPSTAGRIKSSPLARRIAMQKGIDLRSLRGSGPEGRIVKRDLDSAPIAGLAAAPAPAGPIYTPGPGDEVVPLSSMRRPEPRGTAGG